ncbi:MAG: ParB family transcriptional regulator, chromosome partitioning protein [Actinomycetota bacterium]|nr:ParB family transcriptional regulator, chromosome partitioning protein [Actinomycetota bacterium]
MSKRGGLGRGLSALIPGAPEASENASGLLEVPVNAIGPNPKQPRTLFDDDEIASLAASIREVGILQPIVVRKAGESKYEVVAGERRLRAAKVAGLATVAVVVRDTDDADLLREALIENIHRQDLGPIELAEAFRALLEELGLKQEELAERVGVSRSHIANTLRLLQLPLDVQQLLTDGKLQAGHARSLLALGDKEAISTLALRVTAEDLSVRDTEDLVRRYLEPAPEASPAQEKPSAPPPDQGQMGEVEEILSEQLATRVLIKMGKKRGQVIIEFGSADDLERIVSEIIGSGPGLAPD